MRIRLVLLGALSVVLVGCGGSDDQTQRGSRLYELPQAGEPFALDAADFVRTIDNSYWPMAPGSRWVYHEVESDGATKRVEVTVTDRTRTILGIPATVVHDRVTEDGEVVEDTLDWYAQDKWGGVWYLGEDTTEYENGRAVGKAGSWEAGIDGAQAGLVIPPSPAVGMAYRQEHYAGQAEDRGEILSLDEQVDVPAGSFDGVLMTKDTTPLEPEVLEHKFYAKGVGPILALGLSGGGGREELVRFTRG
ncbi:MAG TPA: hypothetical protein VF236_05595 [Gaiellaceae bacterium]